jgi:hypothetical protein
MMVIKAGITMKISMTILFMLTATLSLSGCNTMATNNHVASACEQGIESLNLHLNARPHKVHQENLSRANSLLIAAQVQQQFAEYPGCVEKVKRAQDYLSGKQAAIISRL